MTRLKMMALAAAAALAVNAATAEAQAKAGGAYLGVGGGVTIPTGDFGDVAGTGWSALAQAGYEGRSGLGVRGEFYYGQNSSDLDNGKFKFVGGIGSLKFGFKLSGKVQPYVIGSVGMMNTKFDVFDGDTKAVIGGGAGFNYRAGRTSNFFVEARYLSIQDDPSLTLIPIQVGIRFGV